MTVNPRRDFLRLVVDHNPFYLLSAVCMLVGCVTISRSLGSDPVRLGKILALLVTLNVYEALVIGLGLFLICKKATQRDGRILLGLEALFLVDVTFLNTEATAIDFTLGLAVNIMMLILAAGKVGVVLKALGLKFSWRRYGFVVLELAMLLLMPVAFKWADDAGAISPRAMYGVWWALGLLAVLGDLVLPRGEQWRSGEAEETWLPAAFVALPWLALVAHLAVAHWTYETTFYMANVSPLLLGLTVLARRMGSTRLASKREVWGLAMFLPLIAVAIAVVSDAGELAFWVWGNHVTPERLTFGAMALTYLYVYWSWLALKVFAVLLALCGLIWVRAWVFKGLSVGLEAVVWLLRRSTRLLPSTGLAWGVTAVGAAFVLLGIGARLSFRKNKMME